MKVQIYQKIIILVMAWLQKIIKWIPRPFKYMQRQLQIQHQWAQFKEHLRPHKYKISFFFIIITYPLYQPFLVKTYNLASHKFTQIMHRNLQPEQPTFQIGQTLVKNVVDHILNDPHVKNEALGFVFTLIRDDKFISQILQLLISALQDDAFMKELKGEVKEILIEQLNDQEVKTNINKFLYQLAGNQNIKKAFINLIQDVFSSEESVETLISLLKKGINNQQVQKSLAESINFGVRQVLADEQTLNQLKIFLFFLLRKFENDDEIKGMMDVLFAKGLGLTKRRKDPQLQKILKPKKAADVV